jgi:hypothetical protein
VTILDAAHEYFQEGLNPLPLKNNKAPMLPVGHPFLYQKIDNIDSRFSSCEKIGIACGEVSDGFYCIDFDGHKGEDIEAIFVEFFDTPAIQHLINSDIMSAYRTPSGGFHLYFKYGSILKGDTFARYKSGDVMIEMRGHGQYAAVFPSEGYEYVAGCEIIKLDTMAPDIFSWVVELAKSFNVLPEISSSQLKGKSNRKWPERWDDSTIEGNFNNNQADYAKELLKKNKWTLVSIRRNDGVELWQRPGKLPEDGISATFGAKFNMFYNFSKSTEHFEGEKAYTPFNIYTILEYGGDWKKAKDSLKPKLPSPPEEPEQVKSGFPMDVFPGFLREYIRDLKSTLNFHPDFCAAAALFTIATVSGNRFKLRVKNGWDSAPIFWFACVGYPGTIKTHPVKIMTHPLSVIDLESKKHYDYEMSLYNPDSKIKTPKPKFKQMLISDYTIEALHSIHDINKRGIGLYKDELKGFLNDMNKYRKGSDEEFWLESFNNGSYIVNRVTKEPVMVNNICINMIGTIQHDVLNKVITEYSGNGLIDRFLFATSEPVVYPLTDLEIDNYYEQFWFDIVSRINKTFDFIDKDSTEFIEMSAEVFKIYQEMDLEFVAIQNSEDENQHIKNYLSKMKTYVPRFALVLAIMDMVFKNEIIKVTALHMTNAKKIADYFISTARQVFLSNDIMKDISNVEAGMRNLKKVNKVIKLYDLGFKQKDLARYFNLSQQAISKIINTTKI